MNLLKVEQYDDGYYHLSKDLKDYPDAWCYVVYSKRGPGKTYSALRWLYANRIKFAYIKRTNEDVDFICTDSLKSGMDPSPYSPINRDFGTNIRARRIDKGMGGFYECEGDNVIGSPIGYIISLNSIKRIKGFNLDEVDYIIFDEFIPQSGEIVKLKEGEMLLDLYMTISRDRLERGKAPLKLVLFANAEEISTPITNTLEITDIICEMGERSHYYDEDREILIHHITNEEIPIRDAAKRGIYKAMQGTKWYDKSFEGTFSGNDFTNIIKMPLKGMRCLIRLFYNNHYWYIYYKDSTGVYYMTTSQGKYTYNYNLDRENDQKLFWLDFGLSLKIALAEDRFKFKKYSMYDLIVNYKKYFKL